MTDQVLNIRFEIGQELTHHELRTAYKKITGRELPRGSRPREVAQRLAGSNPQRFEFEINCIRGFAWDHP